MNILSLIFLLLFSFSSTSLYSAEHLNRASLKTQKAEFLSEFQSIVHNSCLKGKNIGLYVASVHNDEPLFSLNESKLFIPASNVKLITSAAALKYLRTDYRFTTTLFNDGVRKRDVVYGNIYLKGSGDPFFVSEELWMMVNDIKNMGISSITGDFIIDDSFFDGQRTGNGWGKNPGAEAHNARIGATSLNFNTVTVYVSPADKAGEPPRVTIDPETDYIKINNSARTVKPGRRKKLIVNRIPGNGFDTVTVKGDIALNMKQQRFYLNISDPPLYLAKVFRKFLGRRDIQIKGKTLIGVTPVTASKLVEHESKPLPFIIRGLNKYSNNFTAEQILKTLGAVAEGPPGTFSKGLNQVQNYLESIGILRETYVLEDGSGLSRLNRLTPRQIVTVLKDVYGDLKIRPEFLSSLSIMGIDGSVKNRLKNANGLHFRTRVKTGSLNGVKALSGYVFPEHGDALIFSMLMNYKKGCRLREVYNIQDSIIKAMAQL